tara:strand:- start:84 stop:224 length:141 start_codon:yes stop_codon:yes gene_type:complete
LGKAAAMAEEAYGEARKRRKGAGATQVAGLMGNKQGATTQKTTLLG